MSGGSGPEADRRAYAARRARLAAERERVLRARSTPGDPDLIIISVLVRAALTAAVWFVGARPEAGSFSAVMLAGGLLSSGSAARASSWRPGAGAGRGRGGSGGSLRSAACLRRRAVWVLLGPAGVVNALPAAQADRLLIGFCAGAVL
jgi:hypothetical protein